MFSSFNNIFPKMYTLLVATLMQQF